LVQPTCIRQFFDGDVLSHTLIARNCSKVWLFSHAFRCSDCPRSAVWSMCCVMDVMANHFRFFLLYRNGLMHDGLYAPFFRMEWRYVFGSYCASLRRVVDGVVL
jgi:hypothetical protein